MERRGHLNNHSSDHSPGPLFTFYDNQHSVIGKLCVLGVFQPLSRLLLPPASSAGKATPVSARSLSTLPPSSTTAATVPAECQFIRAEFARVPGKDAQVDTCSRNE